MSSFRGVGEGKGTWKVRVYHADGTTEDDAPAKARVPAPAMHVRFRAHINNSLTKEAAERHGLQWNADGAKGTWIPTEKKLNEYLATEKGHGRAVFWKEH